MTRGQFRYSSEAGAALGMPGVAPYISLGLGYRRNSTDFSHPENYATFDNYCELEPARPGGPEAEGMRPRGVPHQPYSWLTCLSAVLQTSTTRPTPRCSALRCIASHSKTPPGGPGRQPSPGSFSPRRLMVSTVACGLILLVGFARVFTSVIGCVAEWTWGDFPSAHTNGSSHSMDHFLAYVKGAQEPPPS